MAFMARFDSPRGRRRVEVAGMPVNAYQASQNPVPGSSAQLASEKLVIYGVDPLPARGVLVTNEEIDRLREAKGI